MADGTAITAKWYRTVAFPPVAAVLGAEDATPHWCRHTFATRLHAAGADKLTTKWLLGHSTKNDITAHYTHETVEVLNATIRLLA